MLNESVSSHSSQSSQTQIQVRSDSGASVRLANTTTNLHCGRRISRIVCCDPSLPESINKIRLVTYCIILGLATGVLSGYYLLTEREQDNQQGFYLFCSIAIAITSSFLYSLGGVAMMKALETDDCCRKSTGCVASSFVSCCVNSCHCFRNCLGCLRESFCKGDFSEQESLISSVPSATA